MKAEVPGVTDMPRVLVTGAAGAIGSAVTARLSDRWRLRATDLHAGAGIDELDITDADACHAAFAGIDAVVHLAGNPRPGRELVAAARAQRRRHLRRRGRGP